jgi:glucokinase
LPDRRILAADIGGTSIKLGAVEVGSAHRVVARAVIQGHADRDPDAVADDMGRKLSDLVLEAGWSHADGVGAGAAGLINGRNGIVEFSPNLPAWSGFALGEALRRRLDRPVRVDNDVNAFSLAEWMWGAGGRRDDVVFLTLGTGIGGGIVSGGKLQRGAKGFAGEPGHVTIDRNGIDCACGNRGCAERYVGNKDIVSAARRHPGFAADERLREVDPLTPEEISKAAEAGSRVATEVMHEAGTALGALLVTLVNILNPERVVIGGGVAQAGPLILEPAREHLRQHSLVARHAPPEILAAGLGTEAGLLGAAALLLEDATSLES